MMDILILHTSGELPRDVINFLNQMGSHVEHWFVPDQEEVLNNSQSLARMSRFSHFVFWGKSEDLGSSVGLLFLGFMMAHPDVSAFCFIDAQKPAYWFDLLKDLSDLSLFKAFFQEQREIWEDREARHQAQWKLHQRGRELSSHDFVQSVIDGDSSSVSLFVQVGFSANIQDKAGVSVLHWAVRKGHLEVAKVLINQGANINALSGDRGNTPLMDAALYGDKDLLEIILQGNPELDVLSKDGQTAVILSVGRGNDEISLRLLEAGADPDIQDKLGMSARAYSELFKRQNLTNWLNEHKPL